MLAAGAAAIYVLNSAQKIKAKEKLSMEEGPMNDEAIIKMLYELETKRTEILGKFEQSRNKVIPKEMIETMSYIQERDPTKDPQQIRLLCSQLIQDFIIMQASAYGREPDVQVIKLAKSWLDFEATDAPIKTDQINHRYALSLRSRSVKEFNELYKWLEDMKSTIKEDKGLCQNWILRNFQCCCILGKWKEVLEHGQFLEKMDPEVPGDSPLSQQSIVPLHPLHLFDYIALKLPNQSANFTQVYYNVGRYAELFDPRLTPPLRFGEWKIMDCIMCLQSAFSTDETRNKDLQNQIATATSNAVSNLSKFIFVFGCLVQYPCSWVQVPSPNQQSKPAVLCGPWNDTEMELTASFVQRPSSNSDVDTKEKTQDKDEMVQVIRNDLRLHLDRTTPSMTGSLKNENNTTTSNGGNSEENDNYDEMAEPSSQSMSCAAGWIWNGTFDHEEGLLEIKEKDIPSFQFRKDLQWKEKSLKLTCRTWSIQIVMGTPD